MSVRTRIAPSPTGQPHIGTIYQALFDFVLAHKHLGQFILRIEDTDQTRLVEGAEASILQALQFFGLEPDESPDNPGDFGPYRQSQRLPLYQKYAQQLIDQGDAYYCFCSPERLAQVRQDLQKQGRPPMYDQHCRQLDPGQASQRARSEPHVIRMKIPQGVNLTFTDQIRGEITFSSDTVDDQVILKSDGFPTYHLAVVVDDHHMGITHAIRGEEWISSTPKHLLLYQYLSWDMPLWIHLPLLRNPDRSKISKRHSHTSAFWYRDQGYLPEAVLNFLATRVWNHPQGHEVFPFSDLIELFRFEDMHIQGPIVDLDKLDWLNGIYIRQLSDPELSSRLEPYLPPTFPRQLLPRIIPLVKERLVKLSDFSINTDFFWQDITYQPAQLLKKSTTDQVTTQLQTTHQALKSLSTWDLPAIESTIRNLETNHQWPKRQYFMMLRLAVTSKTATPPLFETIEVLGRDLTLKRLDQALDAVKSAV